ncbi:MAG TPA: hypothetical protein VL125_04770 [Pelobium sp.]|nr:hypothetical protein [Pelobium sp.]
MKNLFAIASAFLLFVACTSSSLNKERALKILQEQEGYPKTIDAEIYIADPVSAKRLIDAGLEKDGYVNIAHTQKLMDVGKPIITFTEKAKPYLIPQTEEDIKNNVQRVKIAEKIVEEVVNVKMEDDGNSALVEYKSLLKDKTPFYEISRIGGKDENSHTIKIYCN